MNSSDCLNERRVTRHDSAEHRTVVFFSLVRDISMLVNLICVFWDKEEPALMKITGRKYFGHLIYKE